MIFQIPISRSCTFHWSPDWLPDTSAGAPAVKLVAGGASVTVNLESAGTYAITGSADRYSLLCDVNPDLLSGLVGDIGGEWFLDSAGFGQFPVKVAHYDLTRSAFILSEPLPHHMSDSADGTLIHNHWSANIPAGALGNEIDRAGYFEIEWATDFDLSGDNIPGETRTERGRLRLVRHPFETGLNSAGLKTLVPQLAATEPPGSNGWQPLVDLIDIMGEVESRLPAGSFADQTLGEQWRRAHALLAAAHIAEVGYAPNVEPERLREMADAELDRQTRRVHWFDKDSDNAVDAGEADVSIGHAGTGLTVSSASAALKDYTDGLRYQPKLNNTNDR